MRGNDSDVTPSPISSFLGGACSGVTKSEVDATPKELRG